MIVAVRHAHLLEGVAAIDRPVRAEIEIVDDVRIRRIRGEQPVVPGAHHEILIAVHAVPTPAGILRAVDAAERIVGRCLDIRVDAIRHRGAHRHADAPDRDIRHSGIVGELRPRFARVGALPQSALAAATAEAPRKALKAPHRRVENARIRRIHRQIDCARAVVDEEHALPRRAAIARVIDATLGVRAERVTEGGDEDVVRILRIDSHRRDLLRLLEADVLPVPAAVGRAVHAVAVREILAEVGLARPDVDDVVIRRRDGDRTDGCYRGVVIGDVVPGGAGVDGLPDATVHRAHVEGARLHGIARHRDRAPAAKGAHEAPLHRAQHGVRSDARRGVLRLRRGGFRGLLCTRALRLGLRECGVGDGDREREGGDESHDRTPNERTHAGAFREDEARCDAVKVLREHSARRHSAHRGAAAQSCARIPRGVVQT